MRCGWAAGGPVVVCLGRSRRFGWGSGTASRDVAELALEHGALAGVPAEAYGALQFRPRLLGPAQSDQQFAPHAWQQVGAGEPLAGSQFVDDTKRRGRSRAIARATAPFSSTTG